LIDLSLSASHAAIMLNLHPKRTIAHLLVGRVDFETIEKHLLPHPSGVSLLAASSVPPLPGAIPSEAIERLLVALKPHYSYIVVDTNSSLDDVTMSVLNGSDMILLVFSPDVLSVQTTLSTRQALQARGIALGKVRLVLNQTMPNPGLPLKMVENVLQQSVKLTLPFESKQLQAVVMGQPLMISDPALPLASSIKALSSAVSATKTP
jgi:pilus assembly protein CpaE